MQSQHTRRKEDKGSGRFFSFLGRIFAVFGFALFIAICFFLATVHRAVNYAPPPLPENILLTYKLKPNLYKTSQKPSLRGPLLRPPTTLHEIVDAIDMAATDDRVSGLVIHAGASHYDLAEIQELRDVIHRFRDKGKKAWIYSESFGGMGGGTGSYYLAAAFDEIWLQPLGLVSITGISSETPFLKGVMEKFGVEASFDHRGQYKSAMESLTRTGMSEASHRMMTELLGDLAAQITEGIAADRSLTPEEVRKLIDTAPHLGTEAVENKLINKLEHYDVLLETAKKEAAEKIKADAHKNENDDEDEEENEKVKTIDLLGYGFSAKVEEDEEGMVGFLSQLIRKKAPVTAHEGKDKIALIYASGAIVPSKDGGGASPMSGGEPMFADRISSSIRSAAQDDDIAAIVLRMDSPGGSPTAAEAIRRAVVYAREKEKKVIVSMGAAAASGGYWAVVNADHIVAAPATLTGSIGVFAGKMVLEDLWKKLGITWESVNIGKNADMWSSQSQFSPTARKRFNALLDHIYNTFVSLVAEGRGMTTEEVEKVAQGRVWTGKQALDAKLVDSLGGLEDALQKAKEMAGFKPEEAVPVVQYPPRRSTLELLFELFTESAVSGVPPISTDIQLPEGATELLQIWTLSRSQSEPLVISPLAIGLTAD
ncbi:MAG: signal peptide peptidase SppA [Alphaproteobacteria bacterium]|nr:MAG: signal peptide peptidase SppA [Alphaproteobacteria bacterium]